MENTGIHKMIENFFLEDDLGRNQFYMQSLPDDLVNCELKIKSDLVLSGLPYFKESFAYLGFTPQLNIEEWEGRHCKKGESIKFTLPFSVALTGERIALNLLQKASSISTFTNKFVQKAKVNGIAILDTRKTTPGLRALEKYAVRQGGGFNHRLGQTDIWMVKDNHKDFFGGLKPAVDFFKKMQGFYNNIVVEVHNEAEFNECIELGIRHVMLDNFSPDSIREILKGRPETMSIEVSGGISLDSIDWYLIEGVDAISIGSLTYGAPPVDLSLKYQRS